MAIGSDFFWKLFQVSGHIGAYLLYTDYRRLQQVGSDDERGREGPVEILDREAAPAADVGPIHRP